MDKLQRLKDLHADGFLSDDEYARRKNEIIDSMLNDGNAGERSSVQQPSGSQQRGRSGSNDDEPPYKPPVQSNPMRTAAPAGGRVIIANAPPPSATGGRVVYMDVNAPKAVPSSAPAPMNVDKDGRVFCFRCGEPITSKVMGSDELKMPNTSVPEPPPVRTYRNRQGEAELAEIAKKNAEYERKHNKVANQNRAKLEKAKEQRAKELARQKAKEQAKK